MSNISQLKKSRKKNLSKLVEESKKNSGGGNKFQDDRLWSASLDKAGNGYAIIRFLDAPKGEELPWVQRFSHGFKGPRGTWYIENCPTTIGKECPVCQNNSELWNSGVQANKDLISGMNGRKRKLSFYANILVVRDSGNPDNEGKVFLFRFGKKIFDKIQDMLTPKFEDEDACNPFDFWEGRNFKLKITKDQYGPNYDKSEFDAPSQVAETDAEIEAIWEQEYSLQEFVEPKQFKDYDALKTRFQAVVVGGNPVTQTVEDKIDQEEVELVDLTKDEDDETPWGEDDKSSTNDDEDDDLSKFKSLLDDDD